MRCLRSQTAQSSRRRCYSLLTPHYSLLTTHHFSPPTTHHYLLTSLCVWLTTYYLQLNHYSLLTTHYPLPTTHYSLLTTYSSLPTTYHLLLTTHHSLLTTQYSLLTTHYPLLTTHYSLLTTHYLLFNAHYLLFTAHYSPLTAHYLLLTTHYSLLATHYLLLKVVAVNRASLSAEVVLSPPLLFSMAELQLEDPWVADDRGQPFSVPFTTDAALAIGYFPASDPMQSDAVFTYHWAIADAPCDVEEEPLSVRWAPEPTLSERWGKGNAVDSASRSAYGRLHGLLEGDEVSENRLSLSRGMYARAYGAPLVSGERYCVMVTACARETELVPARCKNATSPLIRVEKTPPLAAVRLLRTLPSRAIRKLPLVVEVSCNDADSGIPDEMGAYLSLGTSYGDVDLLHKLPLILNASADGSDSNSSELLIVSNSTGMSGQVNCYRLVAMYYVTLRQCPFLLPTSLPVPLPPPHTTRPVPATHHLDSECLDAAALDSNSTRQPPPSPQYMLPLPHTIMHVPLPTPQVKVSLTALSSAPQEGGVLFATLTCVNSARLQTSAFAKAVCRR